MTSVGAIVSDKAALRAELAARIAAMAPAERVREGDVVVGLVRGLDEWARAGVVGLFVPFGDEIPVGALLRAGWEARKEIAVPGWRGDGVGYRFCTVRSESDLVPAGRFGIPEPLASCEETGVARLDFVLVPGLGFDPYGRRLGRGKGFYDRLLAGVEGATCGVGYGCQLVPRVPVEAHDMAMKLVATARGILCPPVSR